MKLNPKIEMHKRFDEFPDDLPKVEIKYGNWKYVYDQVAPEPTRAVLHEMFDIMESLHSDTNMNWVVDYRVRDLEGGDCGCVIPDYHLDVVTNPWHATKPDQHLIFSTITGTRFVTNELEVLKTDRHFKTVVDRNYDKIQVMDSPANTICGYNRFNLHAGPYVKQKCRRVLIRLTQTEVIK